MLQRQLESLKPQLASAAQAVFDRWVEWPDGCCDAIANAMCVIIANTLPHVTVLDGGWEGDDHATLIVHDAMTACGVDIPYYHYERGGGYDWRPIEGARIEPHMVEIWPIRLSDVVGA